MIITVIILFLLISNYQYSRNKNTNNMRNIQFKKSHPGPMSNLNKISGNASLNIDPNLHGRTNSSANTNVNNNVNKNNQINKIHIKLNLESAKNFTGTLNLNSYCNKIDENVRKKSKIVSNMNASTHNLANLYSKQNPHAKLNTHSIIYNTNLNHHRNSKYLEQAASNAKQNKDIHDKVDENQQKQKIDVHYGANENKARIGNINGKIIRNKKLETTASKNMLKSLQNFNTQGGISNSQQNPKNNIHISTVKSNNISNVILNFNPNNYTQTAPRTDNSNCNNKNGNSSGINNNLMKTGNSIKMREINKNVKLNCAFMSKSSSNFKYMSTKKLLRLSEMEDDDNTDVKNKTIDSIRVNNHQNIDQLEKYSAKTTYNNGQNTESLNVPCQQGYPNEQSTKDQNIVENQYQKDNIEDSNTDDKLVHRNEKTQAAHGRENEQDVINKLKDQLKIKQQQSQQQKVQIIQLNNRIKQISIESSNIKNQLLQFKNTNINESHKSEPASIFIDLKFSLKCIDKPQEINEHRDVEPYKIQINQSKQNKLQSINTLEIQSKILHQQQSKSKNQVYHYNPISDTENENKIMRNMYQQKITHLQMMLVSQTKQIQALHHRINENNRSNINNHQDSCRQSKSKNKCIQSGNCINQQVDCSAKQEFVKKPVKKSDRFNVY